MEVKLVEVKKSVSVKNIDDRTIQSKKVLKASKTTTTSYTGLFFTPELTDEGIKAVIKDLSTNEIDFSYFHIRSRNDPHLGKGTLFIDTTKLGLADLYYKSVINANEENKKPQQVKRTRNRFQNYLNEHFFNVACIADIHFTGKSIVNEKAIFESLAAELVDVDFVVLLGDTIDYKAKITYNEMIAQFHRFLEVWDKYGLIEKTYFIFGNHDSKKELFTWKKPLKTTLMLKLALTPYRDVIFAHGDNLGTDDLILTNGFVEEFRKTKTIHIGDVAIRSDDILIIGHLHKGYCNPHTSTMAVPSFKNWLQDPSLGNIGLFSLGTLDNPFIWQIAIEKIEILS